MNYYGREVSDKDYCVVGLNQNRLTEIFPNAKMQGKSFGVFNINGIDFALARKETKIGIGHKGFDVKTGEEITIEEDLFRRDITINSIAKEVITGKIIDPYNGVNDIKNKIIRATSTHFKEDPLRVYRVARFGAMLNFQVEENTIKLMNSLKKELPSLAKERVFEEFRKAIKTQNPSIFFYILQVANVLDVHFKEIYDLIGKSQVAKYHPEGDSYNHTMIALDESVKLTNRPEVRYSVLVHDLGKGATPKEMLPHHYNHDTNGVELVEKLSNRIGVPKVWKKCGKLSAKEHMRAGIFSQMKPIKQVELIERLDKSILGLDGMMIVVKCDKCSTRNCSNITDFEKLGKDIINKVNGKTLKQKYPNIKEEDFGKKLIEERVKYLKTIKYV